MGSEYLIHYGVPHGKGPTGRGSGRYPWGFRKSKESLTPAKKRRIKKIYSKERRISYDQKLADQEKSSIAKSGIKKGKNGDDIISKGTVLGRLSDSNKESLDRRKYVYVTKTDERPYKEMAKESALGFKNAKNIYNYRLEAISDLKVASGEKVTKRIISKYGDKSLKKAYKEYLTYDLRNNSGKTFALSNTNPDNKLANILKKQLGDYKDDRWAGEYAKKVKNDVYSGINKILYSNEKINSDICKYYARKGYDAIVDAEDYTGGFEYPIILLKPEKSVRVKSVRRLKRT